MASQTASERFLARFRHQGSATARAGQPVLFCRADSVYKRLGCDVWDAERDALTWPGGVPVIAHPPCRSWGRLAHFAKPAPGERELAIWSVEQVRRFGGVLEHPEHSKLWKACGMPAPGAGADRYGGWTFPVAQYWFGHEAMKLTWLYIVGVSPIEIPALPLVLGDAPKVVAPSRGSSRPRPSISKAAREHTPEGLATWLLDLVSRVPRQGCCAGCSPGDPCDRCEQAIVDAALAKMDLIEAERAAAGRIGPAAGGAVLVTPPLSLMGETPPLKVLDV